MKEILPPRPQNDKLYLYLLNCSSIYTGENFYKIGITSKINIHDRYQVSKIPYNYKIEFVFEGTYDEVVKAERFVKEKLKGFRGYSPLVKFGGHTECMGTNKYNTRTYKSYLLDKYNLSPVLFCDMEQIYYPFKTELDINFIERLLSYNVRELYLSIKELKLQDIYYQLISYAIYIKNISLKELELFLGFPLENLINFSVSKKIDIRFSDIVLIQALLGINGLK